MRSRGEGRWWRNDLIFVFENRKCLKLGVWENLLLGNREKGIGIRHYSITHIPIPYLTIPYPLFTNSFSLIFQIPNISI